MLTIVNEVVVRQYGAALKMLGACVDRADAAAWQATVGRFPFWHVAYHAMFYTDLYLSRDEAAFRAAPFHREDYNFLGQQPWPPFKKVVAAEPYEKEALGGYLDACREKAKRTMADETEQTLAGPSGFSWLLFNRLELHFYNVRHIQHHTGQLAALLRRQTGEGVLWVGTAPL
jgi:hypothetical protein